jgi:drug/metabolite transporter (DMT)-like permease
VALSRFAPLDRYSLAGLLAIVLWSGTVALARSLTEQLGAGTATAAVYLTGAGLFAVHGIIRGRPAFVLKGVPRPYLLVCGTLFVFYMFALFRAVSMAADRIQTLEIGMLNYLWPVLTILLSVVILRHRGSLLLLPAVALAVGGEFLVLTHDLSFSWTAALAHVSVNPAAYGLAAGAGISWALYSALSRRWAAPGSRGAVPIFVLITGVLMLLLSVTSPEAGTWNLRAVAEVIFLGAATVLAYSCWDLAMRRGDILLVAAASYFTPLLSTLVSCLYLGIVPGAKLWLGCAVLVAGSLLSWRAVAERRA